MASRREGQVIFHLLKELAVHWECFSTTESTPYYRFSWLCNFYKLSESKTTTLLSQSCSSSSWPCSFQLFGTNTLREFSDWLGSTLLMKGYPLWRWLLFCSSLSHLRGLKISISLRLWINKFCSDWASFWHSCLSQWTKTSWKTQLGKKQMCFKHCLYSSWQAWLFT